MDENFLGSSPFARSATRVEVAAPKGLTPRDEERILSLLLSRYSDADEATVRRALDEAVGAFEGARVTNFLPILAERRAAEVLARSRG